MLVELKRTWELKCRTRAETKVVTKADGGKVEDSFFHLCALELGRVLLFSVNF